MKPKVIYSQVFGRMERLKSLPQGTHLGGDVYMEAPGHFNAVWLRVKNKIGFYREGHPLLDTLEIPTITCGRERQ